MAHRISVKPNADKGKRQAQGRMTAQPCAGLLTLGSDHPLGARVVGNTTAFSLFAPRASRVTVSFFRHLDVPEPRTVELQRIDSVMWEAVFPADLHGWYYYYQVCSDAKDSYSQFDSSARILDPYAFAAVGSQGPGIIWDRSRTPYPAERFQPPPWHDLVIVEGHVRDLIRHAPVDLDDDERRGFTGLRKWVKDQGSYLKSLGVNALELQPVQEFGDSYNKSNYHWGYMTVNFFSPESSYGLVPELGSQVEELQQLVAALHEENIAVILDVVYNHVGTPNSLLYIDKYYYFDVDEHGVLTNWSGCGNDLRCDTPMARRLIIDSLIHMIETYDVDGFRFDLAELLGVEVLREIEQALKKVKPSVILIAEPWSFRGHIALELKHTGFASWNDGYREFMRDYLLGHGNQDGLKYFMGGSLGHLTAWPAQTVNYVESHDDYSWIDRITENPEHRGDNPTRNDRRRTHLLVAIQMCSLGIPMIAAGQDGLRTKEGVHNSYRQGSLNAINYHRMLAFSGTHEYFRRWIAFRLSPRGRVFRLASPPDEGYFQYFGAEHGSGMAILYNADHSAGLRRVVFAVNPHHETVHLEIRGVGLQQWRQLADHERFDERGLDCARFALRKETLELPPLTCGLWEEA